MHGFSLGKEWQKKIPHTGDIAARGVGEFADFAHLQHQARRQTAARAQDYVARLAAMEYQAIKHLHMGAVALSVAGFAARGVGALLEAGWVHSRLAKTVPHVVDTVLLLSALALAWILGANPLTTPWLLAKVLGLLLYIALGVLALRPASPRPLRLAAWLGALTVVGWIASVAMSKNPAGFFARLIAL